MKDENINIDDIIDGASRNVRRNMKKEQPENTDPQIVASIKDGHIKGTVSQVHNDDDMPKVQKRDKPGIKAFKTLDEALAAMKKLKQSGGAGILVGIAEDQQEQYDLSPADEKEFYRLMEDLKKFCVDHNLPAVVQIQQARINEAIAISGFRNIAKSRTCGRMLLFNRILDILFEDNLTKEDYSILMDAVVRVMLHQSGGAQ